MKLTALGRSWHYFGYRLRRGRQPVRLEPLSRERADVRAMHYIVEQREAPLGHGITKLLQETAAGIQLGGIVPALLSRRMSSPEMAAINLDLMLASSMLTALNPGRRVAIVWTRGPNDG